MIFIYKMLIRGGPLAWPWSGSSTLRCRSPSSTCTRGSWCPPWSGPRSVKNIVCIVVSCTISLLPGHGNIIICGRYWSSGLPLHKQFGKLSLGFLLFQIVRLFLSCKIFDIIQYSNSFLVKFTSYQRLHSPLHNCAKTKTFYFFEFCNITYWFYTDTENILYDDIIG